MGNPVAVCFRIAFFSERMPPRRKKKVDTPLPVVDAASPVMHKRPPRFFMQRLGDGAERAVRFRSRSDGCRDQALADFFGSGPELDLRSNVRTMDSLLAEVMQDLNLEESLAPEILADAWQKSVGNALFSMSELLSVSGGTACIRVGHPTVRYELTRLKVNIVAALNSVLGEGSVRFVRFISR